MNTKLSILPIAIAAAYASIVIGTESATRFPGVTNTVVMTVERDGKRVAQFIGYIASGNVSDVVRKNKVAKPFDNRHQLLLATSEFMAKIDQENLIILTDNGSTLAALVRDMQNHEIKVPVDTCITSMNNVVELVAQYANGATVIGYAVDNGIGQISGKNPIQMSEILPVVNNHLASHQNKQVESRVAVAG